MGMDPLLRDESYEVTIVLQGPVKRDKFALFQAEVELFITACALIDDGIPAGGGGGKKLQVRRHRGGVRKNA